VNLNKNLKNLYNYIIIFLFTSFVFLSFLKFEYFQFRYLVLFLLFPCIIFLFRDLKNKNYKFIKYFLFFLLFFTIHLLINFNLDNEKIDLYNIFSLFYLLAILLIAYYFINIFNENINNIIYLFIAIFLCSSIISFFNFQSDNAYFCGGIPDIFDLVKDKNENIIKPHYALKLSFKEYIFYENSHLGMVAPSAIAFMIYHINKKELAFNKKILILVFLIICYIKSSTTLFLGTTLSLLILLAFNYKEFSKKIKSIFILIILFSTSILTFSDECRSRFITIDPVIIHSEKNYVLTEDQSLKEYMIKKIFNSKKNLIKKEDISIFQKFINKVEDQFELSQSEYENLTKAVHYYALSIFKSSVFERPFGWGINRYNKAYEYFDNKHARLHTIKKLNNMDGTNNFIKIFVEFGIFGSFFYILIFLFITEKKIPIELKLFYFPILLTQSIRGAGYFNGGFILIAFLMLFTYINLKKKI
jgi:hypothetical protein